MGCLPVILTDFKSNDTSAYDENGCVKEFNDVITFHNDYLQRKIIMLQQENSLATIVYSDYFNGFKWLLSNAHQLGFDATSALEGCCGNDGPSRIDSSTDGCGGSNVPVCSNPDQYINWDGVHFTQKAHSVLASWVVAGLIPKLNCAAEAKYY
uniref:Uncharacterized protein n=2 Tax=Daucus carota subsp. sativus TaxID=79200 RepID=A0A175YFG2_DAUCS